MSSVPWLSVPFLLLFQTCLGQDSTRAPGPLQFSIATSWHSGIVIKHSEKLKDASSANPVGLAIHLNWQRTDRSDFDLYGCFPRHSLQVAFYNLGKEEYGKGMNVSYAIEPHFLLSNSFSLYPKFAAGIGLLNHPYDTVTNQFNKAYSLPVNVYLALGVGVRYQISKHWAANVITEFQHVSNGGLHRPNVGLNFPTVGVGLEFSPGGLELTNMGSRASIERIRSRRLDLQLFGVIKYGDFEGTMDHYAIGGTNLTYSWQVGRIHAWTAAMEMYQDSYLTSAEKISGIADGSGTRVGILGGHEFLLGRFIFSQQVGVYLTDSHRQDMLYHRWGLRYFFLPRWSAGFNLLVHRQTADFTDLRLTYALFNSSK
jgi:hypothetical protein